MAKTNEASKLKQTLVDPGLAPETSPTSPVELATDVVACRLTIDACIVLEIFRRTDLTYGFRYQAWVGWRDAGGACRSHSWWQIGANPALFTDLYQTGQTIADQHAQSKGLDFELPWRFVNR